MGARRANIEVTPGDVGHPFLIGGPITDLRAFVLTFIVTVLLRQYFNAFGREN